MGAGASDQDYPKFVFAGNETTFNANLQKQIMSRRLVGLFVPGTIAGTTLSFSGSPNGIHWFEMLRIDGSGPYTVPAIPNSYIPLDPRVVAGAAYVRVVSDADETGLEMSVSVRSID